MTSVYGTGSRVVAVVRDHGPMSDFPDCPSPEHLRGERTSIKWTRFPDDVLPLFVAEMDFAVAPEIRKAIIERVEASDFGYLDQAGPLATAFSAFAADRWGWEVPESHVFLATDVSAGIVESLRLARPGPGKVLITTPVYPSFFEMLEELPVEIVQVPLLISDEAGAAPTARLDLDAIEREFASEAGIDAFLLCNPHNPHGLLHAHDDLTAIARLAAAHDVFVVSDEIHAPLTHRGETFVPFAPLAAEAGALAVVATSASKGWNLAGVKCSVVVAADDRSADLLERLPPEVACRASIIGLHANVAAFTEGRPWLDATVAAVERNDDLLAELLAEHLPGARHFRPRAGYLAWLDLRDAGLGDAPYTRILTEARVAFSNGASFGNGGTGHVRVNLACAPDTLREAVARIAALAPVSDRPDESRIR